MSERVRETPIDLPIERRWNGARCADPALRGRARLAATPAGYRFTGRLEHTDEPRVPAAPAASRVADLYEYDVVELFLVGRDGHYLELEVGARGHWLALSFEAPRLLADAHASLAVDTGHDHGAGWWETWLEFPRALAPAPLRAANAFAIASGELLAAHPVPGEQPDFHQPGAYPPLR